MCVPIISHLCVLCVGACAAIQNHCGGISYHGKNYINPVAHRCNCKGCGTVLVVDGNMKNNREVYV